MQQSKLAAQNILGVLSEQTYNVIMMMKKRRLMGTRHIRSATGIIIQYPMSLAQQRHPY